MGKLIHVTVRMNQPQATIPFKRSGDDIEI